MAQWFQILFLSLIVLSILRSLLEPGIPPGQENHWSQMTNSLKVLESKVGESSFDKTELAESRILNNKLYEASLLYYPLWKFTPGMEGKYDTRFKRNANRLAEIYMLEGYFDRSIQCYRSILDYDTNLKGRESREVARDLSNMGLVYYLSAETSTDKESKKKLYTTAKNFMEEAKKLLPRNGADYKTTIDTIEHNLSLVDRDSGK